MRLGRWKSVLTACRQIKIDVGRKIRPVGLAASLAFAASNSALADEGGVPFWLSGQFGSLAAAPQVPGWSVGIITYIDSVGASGNVAAAREVTIGRLNPNVNVNLNLNLTARPDLVLLAPDYVFATPVLAGQLDVGMAAGAGWSPADLNGTLTVMLGPLTATRQGEISDSRWGFNLLRIGFELFSGSSSGASIIAPPATEQKGNIAFVPLAMPIMCGPGAIATTLGMTSLVKHSESEFASFLAIAGAMLATILVIYLCLAYAEKVVGRIGPMGIDAVTRIVGFFVSAMGMGLVLHGVVEAFQQYGVLASIDVANVVLDSARMGRVMIDQTAAHHGTRAADRERTQKDDECCSID